MSAFVLGMGCQPFELDLGPDFGVVRSDPTHSCPGGETIPGVLGGWECSCPCHRPVGATETGTPGPAAGGGDDE